MLTGKLIFNPEKLDQLRRALIGAGRPGDAANVIADEGRKFAQVAVRIAPPKSLAQGRKAVARDVRRSQTPLDGAKFGTGKTGERMTKLASEGNVEALQKIPGNFK